ncbi:MAG TPA: NAD(P)/FAD-dependent oxidoreductase [Planctomycetota bacterium]|nr:NAD(P)/FAD-dependent oxidoreductase [Planctomycetota bacterium]HRR78663.1 NAD(P)/FAD-dependent oxidoreductase [Planctomycetota bacterium]HRT96984.1 NAD(P)/FAD-dependent oxidoreductase [Planctomycetota bacterium]
MPGFDVAIIGAGPAGLMAAIAAAEAGARVAVCEQMARPGAKLLATGGGRCNLTNTASADEVMARFGRQGRFMAPALAGLDGPRLRAFFASLGVPTHAPDGFHVFPESNSARSVLAALVGRAEALGVRLLTGVEATALGHEGIETSRGAVPCSSVVLATGGKGYPALGATGAGYRLAAHAGHRIVPPVPGLVPLVAAERWVARVSGVTVPEAAVWIDLPRRRHARSVGPLLFTHRGLSGPAVLDLSADVAELLAGGSPVPLRVDLAPGTAASAWAARFDAWRREHGRRLVRTLLADHLPASLAAELCRVGGCGDEVRAAEITAAQRRGLASCLAGLPLTVTATEGFGQAMITRGGVALDAVNPRTLESRLRPGLFFAGEVLDLDGPCGGYNLQWAFVSGALAGRAAAAGGPR